MLWLRNMSRSVTPRLYISTEGPYSTVPFFCLVSCSGAANLRVPTPVVRLLNLFLVTGSLYSLEWSNMTLRPGVNFTAKPKSPSLASLFLSKKIFALFMSRWKILRSWRHASAWTEPIKILQTCSSEKTINELK